MTFSTVFLITICMLAFVFSGIGIKILLKKNGKFSGTCASQSPFLNKEGEACGLCGATADEKCKNEED
ncbi:MAG: membrane or secreted protein [Flavobacteriales bacterium]|jgi:hypothetical protein|nr:membrane or secreted protein [Flavobacteriales bacterium]MBT5750373.1 membrane or secreted protein [Flavobacteriales bacterium]